MRSKRRLTPLKFSSAALIVSNLISDSSATEAAAELDRWASLAQQHTGSDTFVYHESTSFKPPKRHVVLGDAQHRFRGYDEAYENAPQSLREVEETTGFKS